MLMASRGIRALVVAEDEPHPEGAIEHVPGLIEHGAYSGATPGTDPDSSGSVDA
jgi:hypothetical protein